MRDEPLEGAGLYTFPATSEKPHRSTESFRHHKHELTENRKPSGEGDTWYRELSDLKVQGNKKIGQVKAGALEAVPILSKLSKYWSF